MSMIGVYPVSCCNIELFTVLRPTQRASLHSLCRTNSIQATPTPTSVGDGPSISLTSRWVDCMDYSDGLYIHKKRDNHAFQKC